MAERVYYGAICEGRGTYGIIFPDFLGCISAGDTFEEVVAMGHEALQLHIDGMVDDGDDIPEPTAVTLEQVRADFDDPNDPIADEEWTTIVPILVNVSARGDPRPVAMEAELLRRVYAVRPNAERFIADATRRELERLKKSA